MSEKIPTEHEEQAAFVQWFRREVPGVLIFAIPNGGARHPAVAAKLKAEGVVKGVPDLYIPAWGVWIEMKRRRGGVVSAEQRQVIDYLRSVGDTVFVANGCDEAKIQIASERPLNEAAIWTKLIAL